MKPRGSRCRLSHLVTFSGRMEDTIAPVSPDVLRVRGLISALEMCHHKAQRWVANIIAAIGTEQPTKGLGTRPTGQSHPAETAWQKACAALSAWCAGRPSDSIQLSVGDVPAARLLALLGVRAPLKEWQVQRVVDKIRNSIHWQRPFAACGRNIGLAPLCGRMETVCRTLRGFCGDPGSDEQVDKDILRQLGDPTDVKRWLAASLEKTIRLQLDPPPMMRELSALAGPEWIAAS